MPKLSLRRCRIIFSERLFLTLAGLWLAMALLLGPIPAAQAKPITSDPTHPAYLGFFPKPVPTGRVKVTMHPHPAVVGKLQVVSFGAPFPPGFVRDPSQIRLTDNTGQEFPLFVQVLARWPKPMTEAGSIRSVLIQFRDLYGSGGPRVYLLHWGKKRTQSEPNGWPARKGWLAVSDGSYPKSKVYDPPVYVTLPSAWLGGCLLKGHLLPLGSNPKFGFYDRALVGMADATVNRFDAKVKDKYHCDYLGKYTIWLYDRAATLYVAYFRSGEVRFLRDAHRAAQYYADNVEPDGRFSLLPKKRRKDMKYAMQECLAFDYWLFGDPRMLGVSRQALRQLDNWNPKYNPGGGHWTERHLAFSLLAATTAYELLGDEALFTRARKTFEIGYAMQLKPSPGAPKDGCMIHRAKQHGVWTKGDAGWYCSPWMSTLLVDAMMRYYLVSADPRVPHSIIMLADFVAQYGTYRQKLSPKKPMEFNFPYKLVSSQFIIKPEINLWNDREHALDVAKILAAGIYFNRKIGKDNPQHMKMLGELFTTARWNFTTKFPKSHYKRGMPKAIVSPPRKFGWLFRTTADMDWLLTH